MWLANGNEDSSSPSRDAGDAGGSEIELRDWNEVEVEQQEQVSSSPTPSSGTAGFQTCLKQTSRQSHENTTEPSHLVLAKQAIERLNSLVDSETWARERAVLMRYKREYIMGLGSR
jgi:hypothetical protein